MNIFVNFTRKIIVDDNLNATDVKTSSSYCRGHKNRLNTTLEILQSLESLTEEPISMDARGLQPILTQVCANKIGIFLGLNKN